MTPSDEEISKIFDEYLQKRFGGPDTDAWHDYDCGKIFADGFRAGLEHNKPKAGVYSDDPLACSGCLSGCQRCRI